MTFKTEFHVALPCGLRRRGPGVAVLDRFRIRCLVFNGPKERISGLITPSRLAHAPQPPYDTPKFVLVVGRKQLPTGGATTVSLLAAGSSGSEAITAKDWLICGGQDNHRTCDHSNSPLQG